MRKYSKYASIIIYCSYYCYCKNCFIYKMVTMINKSLLSVIRLF